MTNVNSVFKSFLVKNANYDGFFELPKLKTTDCCSQKYKSKVIGQIG